MSNMLDAQVTVLAAFISNNPVLPLEMFFKDEPVEIIRTETIDWSQYVNRSSRFNRDTIMRDWFSLGYWIDFGIWQPTFEEIMFYLSTGDISEEFNSVGNYHLEATLFEDVF